VENSLSSRPPCFRRMANYIYIYNFQESGGNTYDLQIRYDLMYNKILSFITLHELKTPETICKKKNTYYSYEIFTRVKNDDTTINSNVTT